MSQRFGVIPVHPGTLLGEEEIEKICSGNILRVWSEVERIAGAS